MSEPNVRRGQSLPSFDRRFAFWLHLHKEKLWWLHSLYALLLGIVVMWLGSEHFAYLRFAILHISFIWLSSRFLPRLVNHPRLPPDWAPGLRLLVNFFNKNFYQQMLFFILPIYYASATLGSRNSVFVFLVAASAVLATLDIVYDRHLSVRRGLSAVFFAFSFFALINVMLPILWNISSTWSTRISAASALLGLLSLYRPMVQSRRLGVVLALTAGIMLLGIVERGRSFIPPAPLRLAGVTFGTEFQQRSLEIEAAVTELSPAPFVRLYALSAISAPLGLRDRVRHRWYRDGRLACSSPFYNMVGGRDAGFRLWTSCSFENVSDATRVRLEIETEGGQLIGRAVLPAPR